MPVITPRPMTSEIPKAQTAESPLRQLDTVKEKEVPLAETSEVKTPAAEEEQLSPKFAALARRERAIRAKAQELKAKEDALKARETEYESQYIKKSSLQERLNSDPLGTMNEYGVGYDRLTEAALATNPTETMIKKLEQKILELEQKQTQTVTKFDDQQKQAYDQAVGQIRSETQKLVDSDPAYEAIKETGNAEAVVQLIIDTHKEEGKILSVQEAAEQVEAHLIEDALTKAKLKKVQERLQVKPSEPEQIEAQPFKQTPPVKTLTNAQGALSSKPLTAEQRRQRAILAFKGQLT